MGRQPAHTDSLAKPRPLANVMQCDGSADFQGFPSKQAGWGGGGSQSGAVAEIDEAQSLFFAALQMFVNCQCRLRAERCAKTQRGSASRWRVTSAVVVMYFGARKNIAAFRWASMSEG